MTRTPGSTHDTWTSCQFCLFVWYNTSMSDDQLNDLKQFIDSKISQSEQRIKDNITHVENKVDDVDLKLDTITETLHSDLRTQDSRITRLEEN